PQGLPGSGPGGPPGPPGPQGPAGPGTILFAGASSHIRSSPSGFMFGALEADLGSFAFSLASVLMPLGCTVDRLFVSTTVAAAVGTPSDGWAFAFTLLKNGNSTPVSCSLTWSSTLNGTATCSDTSRSASFNAFDLWAIQATISQAGTPPIGPIKASM